jgi:anti-sigma-K factor RskA
VSDDIHASSAAYALDALPEAERAEFEAHLQTCDSCAQEVARFAAAAARLGTATAMTPPESLRSAVLGRVSFTSQLAAPPDVGSGSRFGSRVSNLLLAAAALVLVLSGGFAWSQHNRASLLAAQNAKLSAVASSQENRASLLAAQNAQLSAVLAAPDAVTGRDDAATPASLTVVASRALDRAVVVVRDLPPLESGQTYQMWWIDQQGPHSAGLMGAPPPNEAAAVVVDADQDARQFAITLEPAGGSNAPTSEPVTAAVLA